MWSNIVLTLNVADDDDVVGDNDGGGDDDKSEKITIHTIFMRIFASV